MQLISGLLRVIVFRVTVSPADVSDSADSDRTLSAKPEERTLEDVTLPSSEAERRIAAALGSATTQGLGAVRES